MHNMNPFVPLTKQL